MQPFRIAGILPLILLAACTHQMHTITVDVIDTSMSITPRAERAVQDAIADQISHMGRGDRLILIPITGDAENDAGGRILRLTAPTVRETYDEDLRRFQAGAKKQYSAWAASLDLHQLHTDILGTLNIARQEFAGIPEDSARRLIVLSDFLEDEPSYRFVNSLELASVARARALAATLRREHAFALQNTQICLGRLESSDFAPLAPERKEAVQSFWTEYLTEGGTVPVVRSDGAGLLTGQAECVNRIPSAAIANLTRGVNRP
jgi:hypothetical protein